MRPSCCNGIVRSLGTAFVLWLAIAATAGAAEQPFPTSGASASAQPVAALDESTLLILSVDLDNATLTDGLGVYGEANDPLIPVGELSRLLELDVDVLTKDRRITGRIGESRRSLLVDAPTGVARIGGRSIPLKPGDLAVTDNEMYLRLSVLGQLFPVKVDFDPGNQLLHLVATEKLPVQGRLERLARRREEASRTSPTENSTSIPSPYRLFGPPGFDVAMNVGRQQELPHRITSFELRAAGDLLYGDFQGYFSTDTAGEPQNAHLLLERRSVRGMFGPLKLRTIDIGDTYTPSLALGPRSLAGRGVFISTVPPDQSGLFHRIDLRGELPLGYDVELYINDVLMSGQNTPNKGRYEFLNVPLSPGLNVIRLVTYGPRGERNEQTRIVNLNGGQLQKGEGNFEFGIIDQEKPVLELQPPQAGELALPTAHGLRASATMNYGLTSTFTVNAGAAFTPTLTGNRTVLNLGGRTSLFGVATQLDLAQDLEGGSAMALGLAGKLRGYTYTLRQSSYFNRYVDEGGPTFVIDRLINHRTEFTLDGSLPIRGAELPLSFRTQRVGYTNGDADYTASFRTSATVRGYYASGGFEYSRQVTSSNSIQSLSGFMALSSFQNFKTQVRASLDYDLLPEFRPRNLAVTLDRQLTPAVTLRLGVGESLENLQAFNLTAGAVFRLRMADLSLAANYGNGDKSWGVGAQLNFGIGYNPASRRYEMGPPGPASSGTVVFHAFMDDNGNGRMDDGEEPVQNVLVEGAEKPGTTGKDGRVVLRNAGSGPTGRLQVNLEKIDALSVTAPPSAIKIEPRPGGVTQVEYPIRPTGEVMVNVKLRRPDGQLVGLSAVNVRLEGEAGYVAEAATEFDGSAYVENVPIGTYKVTVDPEQATRLRMTVKAVGSTVVEKGGFPEPVELEVAFAPPPSDAAAPGDKSQ